MVNLIFSKTINKKLEAIYKMNNEFFVKFEYFKIFS